MAWTTLFLLRVYNTAAPKPAVFNQKENWSLSWEKAQCTCRIFSLHMLLTHKDPLGAIKLTIFWTFNWGYLHWQSSLCFCHKHTELVPSRCPSAVDESTTLRGILIRIMKCFLALNGTPVSQLPQTQVTFRNSKGNQEQRTTKVSSGQERTTALLN